MKNLATFNELMEFCEKKFSDKDSPEIEAIVEKFCKVQELAINAGMYYAQFISKSSIKNLDEKIRLLTALKDGKTFEELGIEPGKPKFRLLFEDYPTSGKVII